MRAENWIQTATGQRFWPMDPRSGEIDIIDIAHALSNLCRFGGHCLRFYSVAEHSVLLSRAASEANKLWALMHDASEAYLIDVPRPLKASLTGYKEAERRLERAIAKHFKLPLGIPDEVKRLDRAILMTERAQNMAPTPDVWAIDEPPLDATLQFWTPERARAEFLAQARILMNSQTPRGLS